MSEMILNNEALSVLADWEAWNQSNPGTTFQRGVDFSKQLCGMVSIDYQEETTYFKVVGQYVYLTTNNWRTYTILKGDRTLS